MIPDPTTTDEGVEIWGGRWATRNVNTPGTFVDNPEDAGMFYQWGSNIGWSSTDPLINSNGSTTWSFLGAEGREWATENNPCPPGWRVPSQAELQSLANADHRWTTINGVTGRLFGIAPNTIFLPTAGLRDPFYQGELLRTQRGYYWSNIALTVAPYLMTFSSVDNSVNITTAGRNFGLSIRCVAE